MRRLLCALLALLLLTACSAPAGEGEADNRLVVGLDDSFPPMGFRDDDSNLVGFDIDLAKALGEELGLPADNTTPEDHLSFEFQFMAKLIERAGAALDAGDEARYAELCAKQRAFFDEHLANWVPRLCADVRAYAQTAFYRGVADITEGFLQLEDQMIGQSAQAA